MNNRTRTSSGQILKKRGDTLVGAVEMKYQVKLGYKPNVKLSTALEKSGAVYLSRLIKMADKTKI